MAVDLCARDPIIRFGKIPPTVAERQFNGIVKYRTFLQPASVINLAYRFLERWEIDIAVRAI
jgi:hypothetical protein